MFSYTSKRRIKVNLKYLELHEPTLYMYFSQFQASLQTYSII